MIGAVVIGMSTMSAVAEESLRENSVPVEDTSFEEQNSEEPVLIAPSPNTEEEPNLIAPAPETTSADEEQNLIAPSPDVEPSIDGSLISGAGADSKSSGSIKNLPAILILGVVGLLVVLLLVINKKK